MEIRPVGAEHRGALESFRCSRGKREPWSLVIEEMVRDQLSDELLIGEVQALGLWDGEQLAGVTVWRVQEDGALWRSIVVAVQTRYQQRGLGRILKQAVIDRARAAGATRIASSVHLDNGPMLRLNQSLGADIERDPEDPPYYRLCTIPLA